MEGLPLSNGRKLQYRINGKCVAIAHSEVQYTYHICGTQNHKLKITNEEGCALWLDYVSAEAVDHIYAA